MRKHFIFSTRVGNAGKLYRPGGPNQMGETNGARHGQKRSPEKEFSFRKISRLDYCPLPKKIGLGEGLLGRAKPCAVVDKKTFEVCLD